MIESKMRRIGEDWEKHLTALDCTQWGDEMRVIHINCDFGMKMNEIDLCTETDMVRGVRLEGRVDWRWVRRESCMQRRRGLIK
jgi:hypothetical protein